MHYCYQKMHSKHEIQQQILSLQKECYTRPRISGVQIGCNEIEKVIYLCECEHLQAVVSFY